MKRSRLTNDLSDYIIGLVLNDQKRTKAIFSASYLTLAVISLVMTFINLQQEEYVVFGITLAYAVLCFLNYALNISDSEKNRTIAKIFFLIETQALAIVFLIIGRPEGFSAIWTALIPICSLLLYGPKIGSLLSSSTLIIIIFFFWSPLGNSLLEYEYSKTFTSRFPFLYLAFYAISLVLSIFLTFTQKQYRRTSHHDQLTGVLNRNGFDTAINNYMRNPNNSYIGFIIGDLDFFKSTNDTYGHSMGDKVLKYAAQIIDESTTDPVCRWGGEEFAIFVTDGTKAQSIAELIRAKFDAYDFEFDGKKIHQTISLGAVYTPLHNNYSVDRLCKEADKCLYKAKESGRNKVIFKSVE